MGGIGEGDAIIVSEAFFDDSNDSIVEGGEVAFGVGEYVVCVVGAAMDETSSQCGFDLGGLVGGGGRK